MKDRDASQDLPSNVPQALTFICEYLASVLKALQTVNYMADHGEEDLGTYVKMFVSRPMFPTTKLRVYIQEVENLH